MTDRSRVVALNEVRAWKVGDVVDALRNNDLDECAEACQKRDIDGDSLLGLSEFALRLWGRDLSKGNMRKLSSFIQDITKEPEKYLINNSPQHSDAWDTDWEDKPDDSKDTKVQGSRKSMHHKSPNITHNRKPSFRNGNSSLKPPPPDRNHNIKTFGNTSSTHGMNSTNRIPKPLNPPPIFNKLHNLPVKDTKSTSNTFNGNTKQGSTSIGKYQQNSFNDNKTLNGSSAKLTSPPSRPPYLPSLPQKPPLTAKPQIPLRPPASSISKQSLPKPPPIENGGLRDIIKSIPFEPDEYESVDDELLREAELKKQLQQASSSKFNNPQAPTASQGTIGSRGRSPVPLPPTKDPQEELSFLHSSLTNLSQFSHRMNEEPPPLSAHNSHTPSDFYNQNQENEGSSSPVEDVYESIPEHVDHGSILQSDEYKEEDYLLPKGALQPPNLPPKPKYFVNDDDDNDDTKPHMKQQKSESNSSSLWSLNSLKRKGQSSPNNNRQEKSVTSDGKKNTTSSLPRSPHSIPEQKQGIPRPLPPPPVASGSVPRHPIKIPLVQMPWYFNVDRKSGEDILRAYDNGTFIIRPSTQTQNPLTLTLKYSERMFNIVVRHRQDGRYALGTAKPDEESFSSVEELVNHYMTSELVLYSNGRAAGSTLLTSSPRKDNMYV